MSDLSLALLGPPVVRCDGAPVTFDTRKATALLALLAVTGREHSREQLADLLWPEADGAKGRASLRRTLSVTAAAMGDGLVISRAAVALNPAAVRVDVREFNALIGRPDAARLAAVARAGRRGPPPVPAPAPVPVPVPTEAPESGSAEAPEAVAESEALPASGAWPLVGREAELAALRAAWQATAWRATGRCGRVVAVVAQAGTGKTRLITELRAEAAEAGAARPAAPPHPRRARPPLRAAA